ncbi:MAG: hypothetical protein H7338_01130 [Candidatus Sericytochromatia bacterium]|nr:hypothetical protein [Candidatus Sericytochromatia bacterium]
MRFAVPIRFIDRLIGQGALRVKAPAVTRPSRAPIQSWTADSLTLPPGAVVAPRFAARLHTLGLMGAKAPDLRTGQAAIPDWHAAGDAIATVATAAGYTRGQIIRDPAVISAMLRQASVLYGVPAHWLERMADRESGGQHWEKDGSVKDTAAVGLLQVEISAYPDEIAGGPANACNNAFDLANNIAIGARQLRQQHDRLVKKSGYAGADSWRDIGPLIEFTYSAGVGALKAAQTIATARGLDAWNWQHLLLGHDWQVPTNGAIRLPTGWVTGSPMAQAIHAIKQHQPNYGETWSAEGPLRRFDFDGDGQAHKVERMLARTIDLVFGLGDPRPA